MSLTNECSNIVREENEDRNSSEVENRPIVVNQPQIVLDSYALIYMSFLIFGIGNLIPWNMFINISYDYFETYKLLHFDPDENKTTTTWYSENFQNAMTISSQIPNLVLNFMNIFLRTRADYTKRMFICFLISAGVIIVTIIFIYINTNDWIFLLFLFTLLSVIVLHSSNGVLHNSLFGMASTFPYHYTNAIIIGQNICGVLVTILSISAKSVCRDRKAQTTLYFMLSLVVVGVCIVLTAVIKRNLFYQQFGVFSTSESEGILSGENNRRDISTMGGDVFKRCKWQFFNVFFIFFVTLSVFPNVTMYVKDETKGEIYSFIIPEKYFMDIATFLNFNFFAFLGNLIANFAHFPSYKYVHIPVIARAWFLFYFPMANYLPNERSLPVFFPSTWMFIINQSILALTSGYLGSLVMMYAPKCCEDPRQQRLAGMISAFCLISGIVSGLTFSWILRLLVQI